MSAGWRTDPALSRNSKPPPFQAVENSQTDVMGALLEWGNVAKGPEGDPKRSSCLRAVAHFNSISDTPESSP